MTNPKVIVASKRAMDIADGYAETLNRCAYALISELKKSCRTYGEMRDALKLVNAKAFPPSKNQQRFLIEEAEKTLEEEIGRLLVTDDLSQTNHSCSTENTAET